jgi:hypothetical protein
MPDYVTFFRAVYWTGGSIFIRISSPAQAAWPDHDLYALAREWARDSQAENAEGVFKIGQFMVYPYETAIGKELLAQKEVTV